MLRQAFLIVILQQIFLLVTCAQSKRGNIGVFGNSGALAIDFNYVPPEIRKLDMAPFAYFRTHEGSASICDFDGNLLFYTNGVNVWNKENEIMPKGNAITGFGGETSTTQILIIPIPKDPFKYYIVGAQLQGGKLYCTTVDMRFDRGRGDVVLKGLVLDEASTEKVCVMPHSSGEGLWLVTHEYGTNRFKSFYIDESGITTTPVISAVGLVHSTAIKVMGGIPVMGTNAIGYMQASHDGNRLAVAIEGTMGTLELFDFDNTTGEVTNPMTLFDLPRPGSYGVEFSPDNTRLFLSCVDSGDLFQFDLQAGTREEIIASAVLIKSGGKGGALQVGPDGRIYHVGKILGTTLDVIEKPNEKGLNCTFLKDEISLIGENVWMGLPDLAYFTVDPEIIYDHYCTGDTTAFRLIKIKDFESIYWDFGDAASGELNFSSAISPVHVYENPGEYRVTIQVTFADLSIFHYSQWVSIFPYPQVALERDTSKCANQTIVLDPGVDGDFYFLWSNGSTGSLLAVTQPGNYWLQTTNHVCTSLDTITVRDLYPPAFSLSDTVLCHYESLHIQLNPTYDYVWNDGIKHFERFIVSPGQYQVEASNKCGVFIQNLTVNFLPPLHLALYPDTVLCVNQQLELDVTLPMATFLWQDGSTEPIYTVHKPGEYWVQVFNRCESLRDTIHVSSIENQSFFIPNVITPGNDDFNNYFIVDEKLRDPSLVMYNRWGQIVFAEYHYKNNWQAAELSSGVYYYLIRDLCAGIELRGALHIIK